MMTVELNLAVNREAVAERATRLGEPSWMVAKRQDALDLAPTLALP
jgi:Fe-S cluster assembly protein SufD